MPSVTDVKIANLGAGFTVGFGFWTIWTAAKQTMAHRSPAHSIYIYMIWGELTSNISIAVLAYLYLNGTIEPGLPIYFFITFFWVFEIQLLMQIIINRIAVVVNDTRTIRRMKWGTAIILTAINISVFIIWIPSQLEPPPIPILVQINKYWDRVSKGIILLLDASLNLYFLRAVRKHLIKDHGLVKYKPLVRFNARLMVVSVAMDLMLIILESLPTHGLVFEQYHPVAYMVKLNIEMTMAALIAKIARGSINNLNEIWYQTGGSSGGPPDYHSDYSRDYARPAPSDMMILPDWPGVGASTFTSATGPGMDGESGKGKKSCGGGGGGGGVLKSGEGNGMEDDRGREYGERDGEGAVELQALAPRPRFKLLPASLHRSRSGKITQHPSQNQAQTQQNNGTAHSDPTKNPDVSTFNFAAAAGSSSSNSDIIRRQSEDFFAAADRNLNGGNGLGNSSNANGGIVRTREVEVRIEERVVGRRVLPGGRGKGKKEKREKPSRVDDEGDYIGRA